MRYKYRLFFLLLLIGICIYLFYSVYARVRAETMDDFDSRQMAHAKQAARGIESFFDNYLAFLTYLSQTDSVITMNSEGKALLRLFYESNRQAVRGVTRTDARGRIVYTFPSNPRVIGADISGQDHVREMMRTHRPVVSEVFMLVQGYTGMTFHVPVFKGKSYDGSLAIMILFDYITKKYLEEIRIGQDGYAWLISRKGVELYCPIPGHAGKTVQETSGLFPDVIAMAGEMMKGKEGVTTYRYDRIRIQKTKMIRKHAAYTPVAMPGNFWSVAVATPEFDVLKSMEAFRNRWFLIIAVLVVTLLLFSYSTFKAMIIIREEDQRNEGYIRLHRALDATVQAIALTVEARDPYTAGHQRRTADLARAIAEEMQLPQKMIEGIRIAGTIHDIGKISVPAEILSKPRQLSEIEFALIRTHPRAGYEILKEIEFPWPVAEMVLQHHERLDGSGYPQGLKAEGILREASIIAVADVVEAIASHRPYRPADSIGAALEEIAGNRGTLYAPDIVDACQKLFREKGYRFV
ncbi:MAG: HD domain-containing phosphohydrolase [Syntrophales bacterium]